MLLLKGVSPFILFPFAPGVPTDHYTGRFDVDKGVLRLNVFLFRSRLLGCYPKTLE